MTIGPPIPVAPAGDWCGEGPAWHPEEQALYWVDINRFLIHRYDPANAAVRSWSFDQPVTGMMLTDRADTLVAMLGSRIIFWKPATDERRDQGFHLRGWPAVRLNDGRPDPRGSIWMGTMRNNVNPDGSPGESGGNDGALFRIDPDGAVSEWKHGLGIGNTLAWSRDRTRFYFADTHQNTVWVYDYDMATGSISNERSFFAGFERGKPDGSSVDSEGFLWNCRYGGGCVVRVAPDGGIDRVVEMPSPNVTNCTFGGPAYRTLYVTSAALGAPKGDRWAGSLFALHSDVPGQPENRFRMVR